jgi:alcohol dehydrogenase class IV
MGAGSRPSLISVYLTNPKKAVKYTSGGGASAHSVFLEDPKLAVGLPPESVAGSTGMTVRS